MNIAEVKSLIEGNPVALATVMDGNKPNVIGTAFVKVVGDSDVLTFPVKGTAVPFTGKNVL